VAQKFTVPISVRQLSSAGSDGISVAVDGDSDVRIKVEAGGRISWGSGSTSTDTNLYRSGSDSLKTDDIFEAASGLVTLTTNGIPTDVLADGALAVDTTNDSFYFRSGSTWRTLTAVLSGLEDVNLTSLQDGQILKYDSSASEWYNEYEIPHNIDGGLADSVYGGIVAISGGGAAG
jgi:hypothetical protein